MQNKNLANLKYTLIFDFGGVLLDWKPRELFLKLFNGDEAAVENFLAEIDFYNWNIEQDKGRTFAEGVSYLTDRFPHYTDQIQSFNERWVESISGPIQTTVDVLQPLKDSGYVLYGLTNWSQEKFELVEKKYSFFKLFESILVSGAVRLAKPDPRIFQMMLDQIGRPAGECILIDDSIANIEAAKQMGIKTIHFVSTDQMLKDLAQIEMTDL